jgi:hypothetical protein
MNPEGYAIDFRLSLDMHDLLSDRSRHGEDGGIGASSFGCREEMRRILTKAQRTDSPDKMAALIGGYIDAGVKQARKASNPRLIIDAEIPVTLHPVNGPEDGFTFPVHPDEIDPDEPSVTDAKTKAGLEAIRRGLADDRYRFQRHLQGLAAIQNGLVPEDGLTVRNVFIDRSGRDPEVHVEQEPFSRQVIAEATEWLDDVLYAAKHGEEAPKDRHREWCFSYCQFASACRAGEIQSEQITDSRLQQMVDALGEARSDKKRLEQLIAELINGDVPLAGLTGFTERFQITSKWINSEKQRPHYRVEVAPR